MKNKALAVGEALMVMIEMVIVFTVALIVITVDEIGMITQRIKGRKNRRTSD